MVNNWSPDPPRDMEDDMSMPAENVAVESEDSEDEMMGNAPPVYELLPQGPALGLSSDEEEQSDSEAGTTADTTSEAPTTSHTSMARRHSEVQDVDRLYSEPSPLAAELSVDCDQVRAAMSGFTLPPSAIPPWAVNLPESQWTAVVSQHIRRIQGEPSSSSNTGS